MDGNKVERVVQLDKDKNFVKIYPIYKFRSDLSNYFIYIIILYYFITSPVIIFGFN